MSEPTEEAIRRGEAISDEGTEEPSGESKKPLSFRLILPDESVVDAEVAKASGIMIGTGEAWLTAFQWVAEKQAQREARRLNAEAAAAKEADERV